ncbi:phage holin family protein [Fictibacillus gelatini]|uniref:phage holin family protein n=1 Tax=Fictibacillus gelatini TaxID=225985 RepID=UPI00041B6287|nr:phage holin family protein [Fictibacillus gelatini]
MLVRFNDLEIAKTYLFGEVKFLDLLVVLMLCDIITGIVKAFKNKSLRSRTAWLGYARKMLIFVVIIVANITDKILTLNGVLAFGTVLFYVANEGLSIIENLAQIGVKVPNFITDRLHVIENQSEKGDDVK